LLRNLVRVLTGCLLRRVNRPRWFSQQAIKKSKLTVLSIVAAAGPGYLEVDTAAACRIKLEAVLPRVAKETTLRAPSRSHGHREMVNGSARAQLQHREVRPRLSTPKPRSARVYWDRCRTETEGIKQGGGTCAGTSAHRHASQAIARARPRDHSRCALRRKRDKRRLLARPFLSVMPHIYPMCRRTSGHVQSSDA
jgi:hypothetical protein